MDVYSRAVVGWSAATHKRARLVLDALQMALWRRDRDGRPPGRGLVHHSDAGSQYTSFTFTAHLLKAGLDASIGSVGDAYDNALMESTIGLYKTELIKPRGQWRSLADVELATAEYISWYNNKRLHTAIGGIPPAEHEAAYYAQNRLNRWLNPKPEASTKPGAVQSTLSACGGAYQRPTRGRRCATRGAPFPCGTPKNRDSGRCQPRKRLAARPRGSYTPLYGNVSSD